MRRKRRSMIRAMKRTFVLGILLVGGVLVSTDYPGVDPDRPLPTLGLVGVAAQLVEDKHPRAVA